MVHGDERRGPGSAAWTEANVNYRNGWDVSDLANVLRASTCNVLRLFALAMWHYRAAN